MNPTPEPASERNLYSEIDEMKANLKIVLDGVAAIGEELERYKQFYDQSADKFANVMTAIQDGLEKQTELNHTFANNLAENFKVLTAFDERLSALENRPRAIRPN
ncbi:MAG TPA: hypothetical protein VGR73_10020 [Bryobacteraceae bacterium]|nr:hypothetical protein [Bryobacteraceae bacterium]